MLFRSMKRLCIFLEDLVEKRICHVRSWIDINLSGFQQENNSAIEELRRAIDSGIVDLKRGISICKVQCEDCRFLCLLPPFHDGMHDCETDHECHFNCDFTEKHDGPRSCKLPYVYISRILSNILTGPDIGLVMKECIC